MKGVGVPIREMHSLESLWRERNDPLRNKIRTGIRPIKKPLYQIPRTIGVYVYDHK